MPDTIDVSPSGKVKKGGTQGFFAKKPMSVGVDIGLYELRLVKVRQPSSGQWELLDCRKVFIESGISRGTPEFADFLRSELGSFCGSGRDFSLWGLIRSDKVDVETIRIPKVGKKQLENAVYWTAKKNAVFDEKETILEFEVQGEVIEEGVAKLSVVVCTASKREVEETENFFNDIGFPLTGLTAAPFALQNLFKADWMPLPDRTATLYIGDDSSRIDVFSGGNLVMTRGIRAGTNSMAEALLEEHVTSSAPSEKRGGAGAEAGPKQAHSPMNIEDAKDMVCSLGFDSPPPYGKADRFGLSKEEIFEMVNPALERLVRQVERTLEHYTVILGNEGINFIYVFSDAGVYRPVVEYIGNQLKVESDVLDPMARGNPFSGHIGAHTSVSQRASLTPALSLALSGLPRTPNLIFTYGDKEKLKSIRRVNGVIVSAFAVVMLILVGLFFWMGNVIDRKEATLAKLDQQFERSTQAVEKAASTMISEIKGTRLVLQRFKERYFGVAIIGEISRLTPQDIYILTVKATMGEDAGGETKKAVMGATISGVVTGDPDSFESVLARYVFDLKNSRMFKKVVIDKNAIEPFHGGKALKFNLTVDFF
ncbi:MAG: hypothetical protein Q7J01_04180 [Syntrophales bacterium]|nr:hypothetical protein [Syntrophales bacterium]